MTETRPPLPPFNLDAAITKVQAAEDAWNASDPHRVSLAYATDSRWRNRDQFITGRDEIVAFLTAKSKGELDYVLRKSLCGLRIQRRLLDPPREARSAFFEPVAIRLPGPAREPDRAAGPWLAVRTRGQVDPGSQAALPVRWRRSPAPTLRRRPPCRAASPRTRPLLLCLADMRSGQSERHALPSATILPKPKYRRQIATDAELS